MEEYIEMYIINEEGKRIEKPVPSNLYSLYEKSGWKSIKEDKFDNKEEDLKKSSFTSKKNDNSKDYKN